MPARRVGAIDYALSAAAVGGLVGTHLAVRNHTPALHWSRPLPLDEGARSLLVAGSAEGRDRAAAWSWGLLGAVVLYPIAAAPAIDAARGNGERAWELFWQASFVIPAAVLVDLGIRDLVGRARPPTHDCLERGEGDCLNSTESTRSFPGGHFAGTSAAAALTCTQGLRLSLYGPPYDALVCGTAVAANVTVGALRIVSDNHWLSDIVAGGALGTLMGWGLPTLLYYRKSGDEGRASRLRWAPVPLALDRGGGLGAVGVF